MLHALFCDKLTLGKQASDINDDVKTEIEGMYEKLETVIVPMFYNDKDKWIDIMKHSIAINASFFNTHRMVLQYVLNSYFC
ncbi:hypothetical protein KSMBR1_0311 [Candidatus Kuenenia stuttgartiensis]|uniref:Uncharacterized protein n=1 Tax=Kuenenia stuttgartiensis TaxID=174633 RepID=A0A2C9CDM0_KUEST|nr:hypothetical protein KSMBR1_0311 [Candidatus Kuenenia stuttgartiensis]